MLSGKIYHVSPETQTFELLKETAIDPKTNEGVSRVPVVWDKNTRISHVTHQKNFANLPDGIVAEVLTDKPPQTAPEAGKPLQLVYVHFYPEVNDPADLKSNGLVGRFTADKNDPKHSKGLLKTSDGELKVIQSRRPKRDYKIHTSLKGESLEGGFWKSDIHGTFNEGKFLATKLTASPLPDPRDTDNPNLPRVMVVGDSISMNYHGAAKAALSDVANYYRVEGNGGPTDRGVSNMELWLGDYKTKGLHWDLIQFNHGLHDLKQAYDQDNKQWGAHQVDIESYKANLEKEIQIMKQTGATLMWCSTTPVPQNNMGKYGRRKGESAVFNKAALEVVKKHPEILINDLHGYIQGSSKFDKWREQKDVHFWNQDLAKLVGNHVAGEIKKALPANTQSAAAPRPNIIIMMSDDMGYSDIGSYGGEIDTPHLDKLAENGLRYTHFYNTGRCCPTRASLLSGLYAHQAGIGEMTSEGNQPGYRGDLSRNAVTIAEALKPAGYRTYMSGKWHVTKQLKPDGDKSNWPRQRGFDRFYGTIIGAGSFFDPWTLTRDEQAITPDNDPEYQPDEYYYTDAISDNAVTYINDHAKDHREKPFFMYVSYTAAHWPMHALPKDIAKYKGHYDDGYEVIRKARYERMKKLGVIEDWPLSPAPQAWADFPDEQKAWELRNMEVYAAMVDNMDQGIGRIVGALKKHDQLDNTLILFLQDNGGCHERRGRSPRPKKIEPREPYGKDELQTMMDPTHARSGEPSMSGPDYMPGPATTYIAYGKNWANVSNTPFREYKSRNHEGGISTPLIAHWPKGITAKNELRHQSGHLIDLMATCVDLSGAEYPTTYAGNQIMPMEGQSLVRTFTNKEILDRVLLWEHYQNAAIRQGKWKLVRLAGRPAAMADPFHWELYDIEADRSEMTNLAKKMPEKADELRVLWEKNAERTQIFPKPIRKRRKK